MSSIKLVPCVKCGHSISQSAEKCPRCGEKRFDYVKCRLCQKMGRLDQMVRTSEPLGWSSHYIHASCLDERIRTVNVTTKTLRCCECGKALSSQGVLKVESVCHGCGSNGPLRVSRNNCPTCSLPIFPDYQEVTTLKNGYSWHSVCYPNVEIPTTPLEILAVAIIVVVGYLLFVH